METKGGACQEQLGDVAMLSEQTLRKGLGTRAFGNKIFAFDTIDSTNSCAKAVAGCGAEEGTVVIADHQTNGRGRHGRVWQSTPNENLMFSIVLRPNLPAEGLNLLPLYVAVAISDAIQSLAGLRPECKWPNDLLMNGKKVAGILIEGSF
jgi:BirA family biotin operon repressor/biotin-[acetyl-CoA-carboxylase] ligase